MKVGAELAKLTTPAGVTKALAAEQQDCVPDCRKIAITLISVAGRPNPIVGIPMPQHSLMALMPSPRNLIRYKNDDPHRDNEG